MKIWQLVLITILLFVGLVIYKALQSYEAARAEVATTTKLTQEQRPPSTATTLDSPSDEPIPTEPQGQDMEKGKTEFLVDSVRTDESATKPQETSIDAVRLGSSVRLDNMISEVRDTFEPHDTIMASIEANISDDSTRVGGFNFEVQRDPG